jgi:cytochrome P450
MNANSNQQYLISPKPPIVRDELAHIGAGLRFFQSPTRFLAQLREQYGDTFLVDVFGYKLFCVFSPEGLKSLYAAEEDSASFGMATFDMLGFKTPIEVFYDADIDLFYELLKPERIGGYTKHFVEVIDHVCAQMPDAGQLNIFDDIRTLEQRVGFQLWLGKEASADGVWQTLKSHFDVLSQENAFVSPHSTLETLNSGKAKEKQAIAGIRGIIEQIVQARDAAQHWPDDTLSFLWQRFKDEDREVTLRKVTHNAINANQGFLSNLYAALAWVDWNKRLLRSKQSLARTFSPCRPHWIACSSVSNC